MSKNKHWKHFDMEETIQDKKGGTIHEDSANTNLYGTQTLTQPPGRVSRAVDPNGMKIHRPPLALPECAMSCSPTDSEWVITPKMPGNDDLINDIMEENCRLRSEAKQKDDKIKEATTANEKWYRYNEKVEEQMEKMKAKIKKLELNLADEKTARDKAEKAAAQQQSAHCDGMAGAGALYEVDDLLAKIQWLEKDAYYKDHQLAYVQSQLRKHEMNRGFTEKRADWDCPRCTLLNPGDAGKCEACGYKVERTVQPGMLVPDGPLMFQY